MVRGVRATAVIWSRTHTQVGRSRPTVGVAQPVRWSEVTDVVREVGTFAPRDRVVDREPVWLVRPTSHTVVDVATTHPARRIYREAVGPKLGFALSVDATISPRCCHTAIVPQL